MIEQSKPNSPSPAATKPAVALADPSFNRPEDAKVEDSGSAVAEVEVVGLTVVLLVLENCVVVDKAVLVKPPA